MREMKDSGIEWIGEIPKSWTITILSALFSERKCKNSGLTENNLLSLSYGNIVRKNIESNEGLLPASFETYNIIAPGNIVFRLTDLQNDKRSLRPGLCQERGIITSAYVTLQIRSNDSPRYMHYLFHTYDLCKVFYGMGDGVRQGMNYEDLKRLRILRPDQETQRRIADYLDRKCSQIDAIIARQQEVIEKLKAYKLSVITEAVTKGLNPGVPMKDSGVEWIGKIPEHWKIGKLCFFTVRIGDGLHGTPEFDDAGEYYFINGNNLGDTYITIRENTKSVSLDEYNKYFIALNENTLLISLNGTIGNVSQYHGEQIILGKSAGYIIVDSRRELTIDYLKFYLQSKSVKTLFELSFAGTTINNLSLETLRNLPVCIMTGEEQFHIAKFLDKKCARIDQVIQKKQLTIDKLNEYKKSLIYEIVTGKKEVRYEPA